MTESLAHLHIELGHQLLMTCRPARSEYKARYGRHALEAVYKKLGVHLHAEWKALLIELLTHERHRKALAETARKAEQSPVPFQHGPDFE